MLYYWWNWDGLWGQCPKDSNPFDVFNKNFWHFSISTFHLPFATAGQVVVVVLVLVLVGVLGTKQLTENAPPDRNHLPIPTPMLHIVLWRILLAILPFVGELLILCVLVLVLVQWDMRHKGFKYKKDMLLNSKTREDQKHRNPLLWNLENFSNDFSKMIKKDWWNGAGAWKSFVPLSFGEGNQNRGHILEPSHIPMLILIKRIWWSKRVPSFYFIKKAASQDESPVTETETKVLLGRIRKKYKKIKKESELRGGWSWQIKFQRALIKNFWNGNKKYKKKIKWNTATIGFSRMWVGGLV